MKSLIVGTAGHIDHGKTALVKALTGIDADRLAEEKRRGITIDLGFAHLELAGTGDEVLRFGFVDVPGHERFVRNMLAGVGGIDVVLLVIAADEGIKPQTREHFDICRLLSVQHGITVLTKCDLVDRETLEVARMEVEEFVRGSFLAQGPIIPVSSLRGDGLAVLKDELCRVANEVPARNADAVTRLPIDRVFTMKGFGTVVTGTLVAGAIQKESELVLLPVGKRVRVRGVQVHGAPAEQAIAGERTAVNLAGIEKDEIERGMMLAPAEALQPSSRLDVKLSLLASARPVKSGARVHLHAFTSETIASVTLYEGKQFAAGTDAFARLRMDAPIVLVPGDRFIVRQFSPVVTIGGGMVLDVAPMLKTSATERLRFLKVQGAGDTRDRLLSRVQRRGADGITAAELRVETGQTIGRIEQCLSEMVRTGEIVRYGDLILDRAALDDLGSRLHHLVSKFHDHNPLAPGISKEELREQAGVSAEVLAAALGSRPTTNAGGIEILDGTASSRAASFSRAVIGTTESRALPSHASNSVIADKRTHVFEISGDLVHLPGRGVVMKDDEAESRLMIEGAFASAGLKVPALKDVLDGLKIDKARAQKIVTLLMREKVLIKISDELVFHQAALAQLRKSLMEQKSRSPRIDVAEFKELTGVSRKYAIPLLEYLDRERVTKRVGDARVIL
jgi:selenocysteine-specific elongation factor